MALKALFRVRLLGLKASLTGANRSRRQRTRAQLIGFGILMLYTFGYFAFMLYETFSMLAEPFFMMGLGVIYFALAGIMSFSLMLVGSVFSAKAQLYEATDNDLLLSMPIPPQHILLSRMLLLLVMALIFDLIVAVPALIAWFRVTGIRAAPFAASLLVFFVLLPLLSLMVSALLGWLLHLATARVRNQSMLTVLLSLVFLGLYFYAISQVNVWISDIAVDPAPLAEAIGGVAPLVWLGRACSGGDLAALGGFVCAVAGLLILGWLLLSRSFLRTATDRRGAAKIKYVEKAADALPVGRALLRRELKRFVSSPSYILNGALGAIMAPVAAVALILKRETLLQLLEVPGVGKMLPLMLLLALCFLAATTIITAPSISLEGKSLWLLQSMPVSPREVLLAKLKMHLLIGVPPLLLLGAVAAGLLRTGWTMTLALLLIPSLCSLFSGLLGLFENLRHPYFDWVNETMAVKSGMSVMATMFIGWGVVLLPVLVWMILSLPAGAVTLGFAALLLILSLLLWRWLTTRGEARFRSL